MGYLPYFSWNFILLVVHIAKQLLWTTTWHYPLISGSEMSQIHEEYFISVKLRTYVRRARMSFTFKSYRKLTLWCGRTWIRAYKLVMQYLMYDLKGDQSHYQSLHQLGSANWCSTTFPFVLVIWVKLSPKHLRVPSLKRRLFVKLIVQGTTILDNKSLNSSLFSVKCKLLLWSKLIAINDLL